MLVYLKEKKIVLIISLILVLLDGLITYLIPLYFNKLNYLYPMLTITFLSFLIKKKSNSSYLIILIIGFIYDILYSNILFYNAFLFITLAYFDNFFLKTKNSLIKYLLLGIINIIIYDSFTFILILITSYNTVNILDLLYKIKHSLLINIMSIFICYFISKKKDKLHKIKW